MWKEGRMWQKEALSEGIQVCNAFMVHRPRKTNKQTQKDAYKDVEYY